MADPVGVAVAFDAPWDTVTPTWTRIDTLSGCRVRGWSIDRGRPNEFEKTSAGTAVIHIVDREGIFDPTNATSPYVGKVLPGKQAAIAMKNPVSDVWWTLFRGYIETWSYKLDQTRQYMEVELQLVDGFAVLSRAELIVGEDGQLPPYTGSPEAEKLAELAAGNVLYGETTDTVSTRILAILGDVGWPTGLTDSFSGNVRVGPKAYAPGTSALDGLFDAVDAEWPGVGNLFCDKNNVVRFRGRQARFRPDVAEYGIQRRTVGDPSAWSLDADVVPVAELEWSVGWDNVFNAVTATPQGIGSGLAWRQLDPAVDDVSLQYATDAPSIAEHGHRSLTFENLQTIEGIASGNDALQETRLFAEYYTTNYSTPAPRITRMVFKGHRPGVDNGSALWNHLTKCEISDLLTLQTEHPGGGGFDHDFYVEGIHYVGRPGTPDYPHVELSLDVSPAAHYVNNPWVDDTDPPEPFGDAVMTLAVTRDLRGYWRLGETSSPWADTSGHANGPDDMAVVNNGGSAITAITGALPAADDDGAIQLNNANTLASAGRYLEGQDADFRFNFGTGDAAMTLTAFVKPIANANSVVGGVISKYTSIPGVGWSLWVEWPSRLINFTRNNGTTAASVYGPAMPTTGWTFVAATYDGTNGHRVYVNGALVATDATVFSGLPSTTVGPYIGYLGTTHFGGKLFYGGVDEVTVWGGALTLAEIQALYEAGVT